MYVRMFCDDGPLEIILFHVTWLPSGNTGFTGILGDIDGAVFTVGKIMDDVQSHLLTSPLSRRWTSTNRLVNLLITSTSTN